MSSRDQFICARCEEPADEDEEPAHCPHCGWDGLNYAFDLPEEVTINVD
jgi:rubrerythrin